MLELKDVPDSPWTLLEAQKHGVPLLARYRVERCDPGRRWKAHEWCGHSDHPVDFAKAKILEQPDCPLRLVLVSEAVVWQHLPLDTVSRTETSLGQWYRLDWVRPGDNRAVLVRYQIASGTKYMIGGVADLPSPFPDGAVWTEIPL